MKNENVETQDALGKLMKGVDQLADVVKSTMGPAGRLVAIQKDGRVVLTKDGVSVAKAIELSDPMENYGASLVKEAAISTVQTAGDGTTTATVLAQALIRAGAGFARNSNPHQLKQEIDAGVAKVLKQLKTMVKPAACRLVVKKVALVSTNGDKKIAQLIADAYHAVGSEGSIQVQVGETTEDTLLVKPGVSINKGYVSPYFTNSGAKVELQYPVIVLTDQKLNNINQVLPAMELASQQKRPLVLVAKDYSADVIKLLVVNKMNGTLAVSAVKTPNLEKDRSEKLKDLSQLTGARVFHEISNDNLEKITLNDLGACKSFVSDNSETSFIDGLGPQANEVKSGVAIISVGSASNVDLNEKMDRVDDALCAIKSALKEGVVPGGGAALYRVYQELQPENDGEFVLYTALSKPLETIESNGYHVDLEDNKAVDPFLVTKTALLAAVGVATTILCTSALVLPLQVDAPTQLQ